jgi:pentatricopeptide repeat protein
MSSNTYLAGIYKRILLLVVAVLLCAQGFAGTLTFERANQLYHNQQFTEALELYNQMIREGVVSESVYYNAGNTHYKLKQYGHAVWCYEKAKQFTHNNILINENLALVKTKLNNSSKLQSTNVFKSKLGKLLFYFTSNQLAIFALLAYGFSLLIYAIKKYRNIHPIFIAIRKMSFFAACLALGFAVGQYIFIKKYKYGIVVTNTILYNNPKESGLQKAQKTQGWKVQILEFLKGSLLNSNKYKIRLPDGTQKWVEANAINIL